MAKDYDHKKIEKKWQDIWDKNKTYQAEDFSKKPKYYSLVEFPYPSGDGLHVGHPRPYIGMDIISRKRRMEGFNVLYPMGWDAFGLPAENYAIKTGIQPSIITKKNADNYKRQMKMLGLSFDWSREINTTDPKYYKWTQWIFLQFLKKGLAYKAKIAINWCPKDRIGLANEEVIAGCCERCGTPVEKREKEQWMLAITKYAERLDKDLDTVDYLPQIKLAQRNWIGKSKGAEIEFRLVAKQMLSRASHSNLNVVNERNIAYVAESTVLQPVVKVFTTRPDTILGATYLVLAPEHPLITNLKLRITNWKEIEEYIKEVKKKTDIERAGEGKIKTGIELKGIKAINPASKEEISVWIADYVMATYGTGAIMAVPADDERDREFAEKFKLPIIENYKKANFEDFGKKITKFKLRDWVFSRQRYWGEPIPVINCPECGLVPVPDKDLPVELPKVKNYQPTDSGESPLANITKWVNVKCPKCKGKAKRETDTMPNWAGSSWYYLRYTDPKNSKEFASMKNLKYWLGSPKQGEGGTGGVDWYNGGNEHTTLHLLYSRFWHKFLYDLKLVPTSEPYKKRTSHGLILAEGGEKMSKSRGNVINPNDIVKIYGADTLRLYEMFMGPFDQAIAWSEEAIIGPRRFLEKVWKRGSVILKNSADGRFTPKAGEKSKNFSDISSLAQKNSSGLLHPAGGTFPVQNSSVLRLLHKTVKKVTEDIEAMKFNTAISSLMIFMNEMDKLDSVPESIYETFLKLLSPFAPHITEEIWQILGHKNSINFEKWPVYDLSQIELEEVTIVVQVNGKVRGQFKALADIKEIEARNKAEQLPEVLKWIQGKEKRFIFVPGKVINIVT